MTNSQIPVRQGNGGISWLSMSQFDLAQVAGICEHCQPSSLASQEYSHRFFFFFFKKKG